MAQPNKLQAELDRIHAAMVELEQATKAVPGRSFYLAVHRRTVSGQQSLRWRSATKTGRHLAWNEMHDLFGKQLPQLAEWYREANKRVLWLNAEDMRIRFAMRQEKISQSLNAHNGSR